MSRETHLCFPLLRLASAKHRATRVPFTIRSVDESESCAMCGYAFAHRVASLGSALTHGLGVRPGDVVAIIAHNSEQLLGAILAITDSGGIAAPMNWRLSTSEMNYGLRLVSPALIFVDRACWELVSQQSSWRHNIVLLGDGLSPTGGPTSEALIRQHGGAQSTPQLQLLSPLDNAAMLVFTSGTTGRHKAVVLSHMAFHAQSQAKLQIVRYSSSDIYLHMAPLFHVGGLSSAMAILMAGGSHIFMPRFSVGAAVTAIQSHQVTAFIAVPTMLQDMARTLLPTSSDMHGAAVGATEETNRSGCSGGALTSVATILIGAGGTSAALLASTRAMFPSAAVYTAYGMTEACSSMTFQTLHAPSTPCQHGTVSHPAGRAPLAPPLAPTTHPPPLAASRTQISRLPPHPHTRHHVAHGCGDGQRDGIGSPSTGSAPGHDDGSPSTCSSSSSSSSKPADSKGAIAAGDVAQRPGTCVGFAAPGVRMALCQVLQYGADPPAAALPVSVATPLPLSLSMMAPPALATAAPAPISDNGKMGEVCTRGVHVMLRYWRDVEETAKAFTSDGWLRTGDLGYFDAAGRLWLLGRAKDMIKSGGENVQASEVEAALEGHPGIAAAVAVGLPDTRLGEQVAVLLVLRPGMAWTGPVVPAQGCAASKDAASQEGAPAQPAAVGYAANPAGIPTAAASLAGTTALDADRNRNDGADDAAGVALKDGWAAAPPNVMHLDMAMMQAHCRHQGLSSFKLPRAIAVLQGGLASLPVTSSGKVIKSKVATMLQASLWPELGSSEQARRQGLHSRL